jgi:hypothetical protein
VVLDLLAPQSEASERFVMTITEWMIALLVREPQGSL